MWVCNYVSGGLVACVEWGVGDSVAQPEWLGGQFLFLAVVCLSRSPCHLIRLRVWCHNKCFQADDFQFC